jgi:predicted ArsR family transcriptional regulator
LDRLADAFGSPTRRDVFMLLRTCGTPMVASEVATSLGLQRTAARAHLERLVDLGLLSSATRRTASAGLPVKSYTAVETRLAITLPPRRYEALARSLLELLETVEVDAAAEHAAGVGRAYGECIAQGIVGADIQKPVRLSLPALVKWMDESGYAVTASSLGRTRAVIEIGNCVYRELSVQHRDIVCAFDCGMFCGMLGVVDSAHRQAHAPCAGDSCCRHEFDLEA